MKLVNVEQVILQKKSIIPFSSRPKYPDFRFQCTSCGSLKVSVIRNNENIPLKSKCLNCTKNWFDDNSL